MTTKLAFRVTNHHRREGRWMSDQDVMRHTFEHFAPLLDQMDPRLDPRPAYKRIEAEWDRYREALERIKAGPYNGFEECKAIARQALSPNPSETGV